MWRLPLLPEQLNPLHPLADDDTVAAGFKKQSLITRALAWEPAERYADARPLLADLELWRPLTAPVNKPKDMDSDMMKTALGPVSSLDEARGVAMKEQALQSARHPAKLMEAADLMEEAFKHLPSLREQYEYRVQVWRRGLTM